MSSVLLSPRCVRLSGLLSVRQCLDKVGQRLHWSAYRTWTVYVVGRRMHHSDSTDNFADKEKLEKAPLHGIKVLDLSRILAGPFCTMVLGDMGADVIKVEKPGIGDDTRSWGPPWVGKESAYYLSINRNKKSIAVDMKAKEGYEIIKQLAMQSDVLIENYLPGKLSQLGLGYDQLKLINRKLIYVSISGFGSTGPYAKRGGFDSIAIAIGGMMHITGPEGGEPCRTGVAMIDLATGLYAVGAISAALLHRQKTGKGQHIECNLLSTDVSLLSHIASNWLNCGVESKRWGTAHPSLVPYQAFATKGDGRYMILGAGSDHQFHEICKKLGLEELSRDERYKTNNDRVINRIPLIETLSKRVSEKSLSEWMQELEGASFPYGPVNNIQEVFSNQQVLHNQSIQEMTHPTAGKIRLPNPAVSFSDSPTVLQRPPPTLGEHTFDVLHRQLNYPTTKIDELERTGVVATSIGDQKNE